MQLTHLTWTAVQQLDRTLPVVIPIAAVEQHGHHLPVSTDAMLLEEVVRRADAELGPRALFAPLQWMGNSHHHTDFPGTVSASPRVYLDMLHDLAENFLMHGFTRLLFLNGHGGNNTPAKQALFELRQKYRTRTDLLLLFATYWDLAKPHETRAGFVQTQMGHACEWETSMIMRIAPHLVIGDISKLESVTFEYGFGPAYRAWITKDRTVKGHIGSPQHATAEKGEHLFASFAAGVAPMIDAMAQHDASRWL